MICLNIAARRFENVHIWIFPVKVQGNDAVEQIVEAIEIVNRERSIDVAILARGGGSLEDLQAFNSEKVARAIFASEVPIVSAVGHETDYTIADFVADLRAPTPSAAAELVLPVKSEFKNRCDALLRTLTSKMLGTIENHRLRFNQTRDRLVHPKKRIQDHFLRMDDLYFRIVRLVETKLQQYHERLSWKTEKLWSNNPGKSVEKLNIKVEQLKYNLQLFFRIFLDNKRSHSENWHQDLRR
jgi:exodeoxyribonuclease VII large subunit